MRALRLWVLLCPRSREAAAKVVGVGCEAAVVAELEDDVGWRGRRGISTASTLVTTTEYLMAATMILSYVLRCS
jgi:hypothetical protein